eukprot:scaffold7350_cov233-Pinguiococcus_pyrenoidosus.AAC.9
MLGLGVWKAVFALRSSLRLLVADSSLLRISLGEGEAFPVPDTGPGVLYLEATLSGATLLALAFAALVGSLAMACATLASSSFMSMETLPKGARSAEKIAPKCVNLHTPRHWLTRRAPLGIHGRHFTAPVSGSPVLVDRVDRIINSAALPKLDLLKARVQVVDLRALGLAALEASSQLLQKQGRGRTRASLTCQLGIATSILEGWQPNFLEQPGLLPGVDKLPMKLLRVLPDRPLHVPGALIKSHGRQQGFPTIHRVVGKQLLGLLELHVDFFQARLSEGGLDADLLEAVFQGCALRKDVLRALKQHTHSQVRTHANRSTSRW